MLCDCVRVPEIKRRVYFPAELHGTGWSFHETPPLTIDLKSVNKLRSSCNWTVTNHFHVHVVSVLAVWHFPKPNSRTGLASIELAHVTAKHFQITRKCGFGSACQGKKFRVNSSQSGKLQNKVIRYLRRGWAFALQLKIVLWSLLLAAEFHQIHYKKSTKVSFCFC